MTGFNGAAWANGKIEAFRKGNAFFEALARALLKA